MNNQLNQMNSRQLVNSQVNVSVPGVELNDVMIKENYERTQKIKRRSGIFLLFLLLLITIGVNVLNSLYFRSLEITKYSIIFFLAFLIPILFTKFDLHKFILRNYLPFLQEPNDFFKKVK